MPQTRSGKEFSPYAIVPLVLDHPVDFEELLQASTEREQAREIAEDAEEDDCVNTPPFDPTEPAPSAVPPPTLPLPVSSTSSGVKRTQPDDGFTPTDVQPPTAEKQSRGNWKRRKKRAAKYEESGHVPSQRTIDEVVAPSDSITTALEPEALPVKLGAYAAKNAAFSDAKREWTLPELLAMGFQLVKWDGE